MKPEEKVRVVVKSRRVPLGTFIYTEPVFSASGVLVGHSPATRVLFGTSYDQEHQRTIEEARKFAANLGLGLEVVDESRSGPLGRLLSRFALDGPRRASVTVPATTAAVAADPSPNINHGC